MVKRAKVKKVRLVSLLWCKMSWKAMLHVHVLPPTNQTCLAINPVVVVSVIVYHTLWKVVAKCRSIKLFIFFNWKPNSLCWYSSENESCLQQVEAICYSREAVSLWVFLLVRFRYWITLERFWIKPQLSQKVLLPDWATRIQNLVVLMKFLVAARKQAAFNV